MSKVSVIADLPPPIHGMGLSNMAVYKFLQTYHEVKLFNTSARRRLEKLFIYLKLYFQIIFDKSEVYYVSIYGGWGIVYQIPLLLILSVMGKKVVVHHHSYRYINSESKLMRISCKYIHLHIFLSEKMKSDFELVYGSLTDYHVVDNSWFIDNVSTFDFGSDRNCSLQKEIVIGFIGALEVGKGIVRFLEDLGEFQKKSSNINVTLLICGKIDGTLDDSIRQKIVESGAYIGPLYGEDKYIGFYNKIDIFYFPTSYIHEAQPLTIYEALSSGAYVISSDIGTISEQISDARDGTVIRSVSSEDERLKSIRKGIECVLRESRHERARRFRIKQLINYSHIREVVEDDFGF